MKRIESLSDMLLCDTDMSLVQFFFQNFKITDDHSGYESKEICITDQNEQASNTN